MATAVGDSIFGSLNIVILGYGCLVFLPKWRHTQNLTLALALTDSVLYAVLLLHRVATAPLPPGSGFGSLDAVVALFSDREVVLAGWTHYIAFDLMIARHIVIDSQASSISHLAIFWTLPLTLMAGPAGLAAYYTVKLSSKLLQQREQVMDIVLQVLYVGVAFFAVFMLLWILAAPATWRLGNTPGWEETLQKSLGETGVVPMSLVLKYTGHRAVQFTHILPSAVWAFVAPFQLHPGFRKTYRKTHRRFGYAFFMAALLMMIGFAIIDYRKLDFIRHDFPTVPHDEARSALGLGWVPHLEMFRCVGVAFLAFAALALRAAINRDFASHKKWVLRHIGMGLWIAPQRMYVLIMQGKTPRQQKAIFTDGTFVGLALTVIGAELAVWIYHWQALPKAEAKSAVEAALIDKNPKQPFAKAGGASPTEAELVSNKALRS